MLQIICIFVSQSKLKIVLRIKFSQLMNDRLCRTLVNIEVCATSVSVHPSNVEIKPNANDTPKSHIFTPQ